MAPFTVAGDWPNYRGPDSNTAYPARDYPLDLTPDKNVVWRVDLAGEGSSSPIVLGDAIFLTSVVDGKDTAASYGLDGRPRWTKTLGPGTKAKHRSATGANPSPATDGERVFAYYKSGLVAALSLEGEELWRVNLQEKYGENTLWWDLGTSPVVTPAGVLIAVMQAGDSYLVTLDAATGEVVWKTPRRFDRPKESDQSYTTPIVADLPRGKTIVTFGADHLTGHDPHTGEQLFVCGGFNPNDKPMWRVIGSPTIAGDIAVVTYGRGEFMAGVKLAGSGDITETARLWTRQGVGADVPCPVISGERVYLLGDKGELTCLDLLTGETLRSSKLPRSRQAYYATPLMVGNWLYCVREDGKGHTVVAHDAAEILGEIDLGDDTVVTPVPIGHNRLLVRTRHRLYLFGKD